MDAECKIVEWISSLVPRFGPTSIRFVKSGWCGVSTCTSLYFYIWVIWSLRAKNFRRTNSHKTSSTRSDKIFIYLMISFVKEIAFYRVFHDIR